MPSKRRAVANGVDEMNKPASKVRRHRAQAQESGATFRRPVTRTEDLLHKLEGQILSGAIPPGSRLDELGLASQFKVSRTPVREALLHLASSGLIQIRPRQGAIVRQFTISELLEMFQVMAELEGLCARLSARRMTVREKSALRRIHQDCSRYADEHEQERFLDANAEFHDAIFVASRNRFLLQQVREMRKRLDPYRRHVTRPELMRKSADEHEQVLLAIEEGRAAEAHDLMRAHLNMLGEEAGDLIAALAGIESSAETGASRTVFTGFSLQSPDSGDPRRNG
jgi:DNA-binding GntR family transcriptional regulator